MPKEENKMRPASIVPSVSLESGRRRNFCKKIRKYAQCNAEYEKVSSWECIFYGSEHAMGSAGAQDMPGAV